MIKQLANDAPWPKIISAVRFGVQKLSAVDRIEKKVQKLRAVEAVKGTANRLYKDAIKEIDEAADSGEIKRKETEYTRKLDEVVRNPGADPLVVGITGEFYVVLEPFSNLDVENELGKLGAEVRRMTYTSDWLKYSMFLNPLGIDEKAEIHRAAMPYLKRDIGGDGWESVGEKVLHSGVYDGMVHLAPFTCMPEIIARNIMPSTKEDMPVLTITCDEQVAKTGMLTRLEAFVDLLERKKRSGKNGNNNATLQGV
jgi:predicted nucleotide-binding protein (sugar kinase/HSP70/actin superfamily)